MRLSRLHATLSALEHRRRTELSAASPYRSLVASKQTTVFVTLPLRNRCESVEWILLVEVFSQKFGFFRKKQKQTKRKIRSHFRRIVLGIGHVHALIMSSKDRIFLSPTMNLHWVWFVFVVIIFSYRSFLAMKNWIRLKWIEIDSKWSRKRN